ncbi:ATP-binding protein [Rhodoferax koreense]|nr:ATP-binding protein [Rhodoferax koreense]
MDEITRVGEARRHAALLMASIGFDTTTAGRVALIVTELGTNLVKHARQGKLLIASRSIGEIAEMEIVSMDAGPGIPNLDRAMADGYSTGGTSGTGLGAVRRLACDFDAYSDLVAGTVIVARVRPQGASAPGDFLCAAMGLAAPGELACGDGWAIAVDGKRAAVLLADGLGHGPQASEAAQAAVALFARQPFADLKRQVEDAHVALRMTRGAALSVVQLDRDEATIRSAGAGNVLIRMVSGTQNRSLMAQHGTVGVQIKRVEELQNSWPEHAMVVLHTDGVISRWPAEALTPLLNHDPGLAAAVLLRDYVRGKDDATVVVLRRRNP